MKKDVILDLFGLEISTKKIVNSIIYLLAVFVVYLVVKRIIRSTLNHVNRKKHATPAQKQRVRTVFQMLTSVLKYIMIILAVLVVLANFGVNVSSLIAGLGIATAIMGLAFQDMIKDFIAGLAILIEGQFYIGDTVEVSGFKGTVLSVGLKTTEIKNSKGHVKIIANHNIDGLVNYSKFKSDTSADE